MRDLTKSRNRQYYRSMLRIKLKLYYRLFTIWIANRLMKTAFKICPTFKRELESRLRLYYYDEY